MSCFTHIDLIFTMDRGYKEPEPENSITLNTHPNSPEQTCWTYCTHFNL